MAADEKTCPMCAETIKKAAKICKHCGHQFPEEQIASDPIPSQTGKNIGIGCLAIFGLLLLVGMCAPGQDQATDAASPSSNTIQDDQTTASEESDPTVVESNPVAAKGDWVYSQRQDELRGRTEYYADVVSENSVSFDFPYSGGSTLRITIRKSPQYGEDVIFRISNGQFVCGVYDCNGAISFDGNSERLTLATPSDHSSDVLFAKYGSAIIRKLKSSDRTVVELPFYQEGNRQFTFATTNLEWPPKN